MWHDPGWRRLQKRREGIELQKIVVLLRSHCRGTSLNTDMPAHKPSPTYRILTLDGGGAKGFYSLGVLKEVEAMLGKPLSEAFDLIFGTSTGAIIAALLALGNSVDEIHTMYRDHVPAVMGAGSKAQKSAALARLAEEIFRTRTFTDVKTDIGIVSTRWMLEKPMIFKSDVRQAHGRAATFVPGFGCTISQAVQASCSAYPFFEKQTVTTSSGDSVELIDGGYCANNPTLYAIADAVKALKVPREALRVLSIGVGVYPEPKHWHPKRWGIWFAKQWLSVQLLQKTLNINTASMEQLRAVLFSDIQTIRISDTFAQPEMATDLLESDLTKLNLLYQRGGESFANHEEPLRAMLG
jgi:patatin-like phospholipase/acyl hydrolase